MFMSIKTIQLFLFCNAQADGFVNNLEDDKGHNDCEYTDGNDAEDFHTDELDTAHTVFGKYRGFCEYTGQDCTDHTTAPVNAGSSDRVVDFKDTVNKFNNENNCKATDNADGQSAIVGYDITAGGDTDIGLR